MRIKKKTIGRKMYFYLEHSFRDHGKVEKKELYLGTEIPGNIQKIKTDFIYEVMKKKYLDSFDAIKKKFAAELKEMPPSARQQHLQYFLIKFTYDTNRIEGSTITLKETAKLLEHGIVPANKPLHDIKETESHNQVVEEMLQFRKDLSLQVVLQWHRLLLQHTHPDIAGKIRRHQVKVAGSKTEFPTPVEIDLLLNEFINWYRHQKNLLHPIELAALVHLKFVSIHPFSDGNGRISRLLMNFVLHQQKYPMLNIKYVNRDSYYNALERAQTTGQERIFVLHIFKRYLKEYPA